ncbi:hypothetical protein COU89_01995 [Candidatus Roizmanbacteria bacterium CG10_big_fil_rev_8_21_14_0_10_45_7]|uniref:Phosphatidic acid phosphatase type 2/haloperoxidase domain-containing protein n=1 Tax=Candidatus Roizmanbacteria bacterium CG10_big_fil_rev_8_21_14_0_10_45_7 TaxID=1974854 RepID=A0A2M8KUS9_9BACT|nr:MAG: hypothetical protein COU89_01995 [Candidatus Roizmanbacteria bacterium CG10_big_fil_rev_8_21_14_0_10_45_7]
MKKIFAEVVSRVLDPVWEIPIAIMLAIVFAVREGLRWRFLGLILFIDAVVPMIFFLMMLYHKQINDWDIQNRAQRIPLYLFTLICHLGGLWLAHELGKAELVNVLSVFYGVAIVFFVITLKWKISLHAGVNAVLITTINMFYDWQYAWLYILLYLVMWARVYQKHHTWAQVILGALLGGGMVAVGMWLV